MPVRLTDPTPLPTDARCPQCGAKPELRVELSGFGPVHERPVACGVCGCRIEGQR